MTLNLSDNSWLKPTLISLGAIVLIGFWLSLAGGIFLVAFHKHFNDATPLTLYRYWYYYGEIAQIKRWLWIAVGVSTVAVVVPGMAILAPAKRPLFGNARFATRHEIMKAGLFGEQGIIVGRLGGRYLRLRGEQHAIISAPTRSGKGVGIVIPNLLNWPDSIVVLDIKRENWDKTSGFRRKHGQDCYLFNPLAKDYCSHRYNPLAYISTDRNFRIDDIQKIGGMLFPDKEKVDPIWTATPRNLFLGIVLYLLETNGKLVTIGQVLRETLANGDGAAYFAHIIADRTKGKGGPPLSAACVRSLNSYISIAAATTRAGIITAFRSRLELWMNPLIDAATSANDFDLRKLRSKRMSIYIGVTPDNLERVAPLLNLFFQQLIDLNTRELPTQNPDIKFPCLMLLDEFTSIGKIPILSKGISYLAGYWLRMLPIIQSPAQIVDTYGKEQAKTFTTNHALQIVFPPKASETETARDISEWLGYQTVKGISESKPKWWSPKRIPNQTASDQRRALLLPQEITSLGRHRALIVMEDCPPILARKVRYYDDRNFTVRLLPAAPVPIIDVDQHNALVAEDILPQVPAPAGDMVAIAMVARPVVPADMPDLSKLSLANFSINFSPSNLPKETQLDVDALHAYADLRSKEAGLTI